MRKIPAIFLALAFLPFSAAAIPQPTRLEVGGALLGFLFKLLPLFLFYQFWKRVTHPQP